MSKRVAITGSGVVSALGNQSEELHRALCDGACGVRPIQLFECKQSGGEIPEFDARAFLGEGNLRPLDRIAQLAA
ncbi:MAG: beta-ketoacyl-[acyl-carrier-protein] synthase II, partial [Candidatus Latescibacteria bacterium]|nr:beta-ketoacyl-[acyl-carrier-protein] synthase II [Candidatus Latescibacterota bacterium]